MPKGRPKKVRYIQKMPKIVQFSPRGRPGRPDEVELTIDQFEAFKLADYQGFTQSQGASAMRLSRASFGRILRGARYKIADALTNGKTIKIRMGNVQIGVTRTELTADTINQEVLKFEGRSRKIIQDVWIDGSKDSEGTAVKIKSPKE